MTVSPNRFRKSLVSSGLMSADEVQTFWQTLSREEQPTDGETFSRVLIDRGRLTPFQAAELLAGGDTPLVLGDYVLVGRIGAGGMGQVFKAQHRHMKRAAAIKLLPKDLTKNEDAIRRFQREVEVAAKLSHPNIVQTYDAGVQKGVWYLVMEFVDGRDLSVVVAKQGPLPVGVAVDYVRQAARGLAFAHESGVVHRDIKPANLLLDNKGTVKILDMGLARIDDEQVAAARDGLTQPGQVMGTVDYMAPEQALDTRNADARVDIYSLGCTLWRLLTGQNLYQGETLVRRLLAHQAQPIPSLVKERPDVPPTLGALFERMVAKQPAQRVQTMVEVEALLAPFAEKAASSGVSSPPRLSAGSGFAVPDSAGARTVEREPTSTGVSLLAASSSPAGTEQDPAATVTLSSPLQATDPVSERSVQLAREQSSRPQPAVQRETPPRRVNPLRIAAGLGGILLVLLGVWVIVKDKDGKEVARIRVPEGGRVEIESAPQGPQGPQPAKTFTNSLGMEFVLVPKGSGWLGGGGGTPGEQKVEFPHDFYLGKYEVTQEEWEKVTGQNPSHFSRNGAESELVEEIPDASLKRFPVEHVSWNDCQLFVEQLNRQTNEAGWRYRLPTEAEWEYACRGGAVERADSAFHFYFEKPTDSLLPELANSPHDRALNRPCKVGSYPANRLGLHDLHGNVWEWCADAWTDDSSVAQRVLRGGSWHPDSDECRATVRSTNPPTFGHSDFGLRLARVPRGMDGTESAPAPK
ncbi:MAG: bifunctional serine/threonine-protein kinase/formylglycine-generating enzyme family protein [Pirellulales bacterium]